MALVRLRPRSRRSPDPKGPFDTWTIVGSLDSPIRSMVDPSGRIAVRGAGWVVDWWIGAEDRWHQPAREAAVRQQLVGASPVVETRVKVPSGDAVARCYGARGSVGEDLVVLEVENDSKVPFALALVVRPAPGRTIRSLRLEGSTLVVDDAAVLHLARSPGRFAMSTSADAVAAGDVVLGGDAEPVRAHEVRCAEGAAQAALLFPLAHTANLRVAIAPEEAARSLDPATLPSASQVASGWATHSRSGARIEVPDRRLREAIAATTRSLLLDGSGPSVERALLQLGFPAEARGRGAGVHDEEVGDALAARADRWRLHREPLTGDEVLSLAALVERWARQVRAGQAAGGHTALPAVAAALDASGEERAATDVRAVAGRAVHQDAEAAADLYALVAEAGPTFTWARAGSGPHPADAARFLLAVRAHLVDDAGDDLVLSPLVPEPWLGQGWEVHDLPTAHGTLSFAIRWHGERPALLWELDPPVTDTVVRLTCGLDPSWSTRDAAGEALLGPVAVPERPRQRRGLTIPVTIEPIRRRA